MIKMLKSVEEYGHIIIGIEQHVKEQFPDHEPQKDAHITFGRWEKRREEEEGRLSLTDVRARAKRERYCPLMSSSMVARQ